MIRPPQHIAISLILVLGYFTLAGCNTTGPNIKLAEELVQQGQWDAAVGVYREAYKKDPFNDDIGKALAETKIQAAQIHF